MPKKDLFAASAAKSCRFQFHKYILKLKLMSQNKCRELQSLDVQKDIIVLSLFKVSKKIVLTGTNFHK
jgi:hypothetical protein